MLAVYHHWLRFAELNSSCCRLLEAGFQESLIFRWNDEDIADFAKWLDTFQDILICVATIW